MRRGPPPPPASLASAAQQRAGTRLLTGPLKQALGVLVKGQQMRGKCSKGAGGSSFASSQRWGRPVSSPLCLSAPAGFYPLAEAIVNDGLTGLHAVSGFVSLATKIL